MKTTKQDYLQKAENVRRRLEQRKMRQAAKEKPCEHCGGEYPHYVMRFDQRDPSKRSFSLNRTTTVIPSNDSLIAEMAKCAVVCANCHAARVNRWGVDRRA